MMKDTSPVKAFHDILGERASHGNQGYQEKHSSRVAVKQGKKGSRARNRENKRRQHEAFLRLTRSWVKTPCVICNIEGHLMKDCPRNARRRLNRKIQKRIKYVVRPSSARRVRNRLLLSHHSKVCSGTPDRHQLLPSLDKKERERLRVLAFAVKRSLEQAVEWAEEARKTAASLENARQGIKRHGRRILSATR